MYRRSETLTASRRFSSFAILAIHMVALFGWALAFDKAHAAAITTMSDTMSSLKVSTASNHDISFVTPTGITTGQTITVTFPGSSSIAAALDFTDVDVLVQGVQQTLGSANGASTWGVARTSATVLTITAQSSGTPAAAGNTIRIKIGTNATNQSTGVRQVTNDTSTGSKTIAIGGTMADSGNITVQIITDDTVVVSATVNQAINFSISDNTVGFGTLSSSAARYATGDTTGTTSETEAHQIVAGTNAASGYVITINGNTLTSGSNTITAIGTTNTASSTGSEQFGVRMTATGGTGAVTAPYAASGFALDTAAFPDQIASASAGTADTTYSVRYLANISSATEAGTYNASLTYIMTSTY